MFDTFRRGWEMAKASGAVLKDNPRLLVFPVLSGIALIAVSALLLVPFVFGAAAGYGLDLSDNTMKVLAAVAAFVWYFFCTFVIVFCNAALVGCALRSFNGQQPSIGFGLAAAGKRLPQILGWSLLAATVGAVLRGLQTLANDKLGFVGALIEGIAATAWSVATYFVVPVVVTEGLGPINAVKRSSSILRRTWGESLVGSAGLGAVLLLFVLPVFGFGALLVTGVGGNTGAAVIGAATVVYVLVVTVVYTALSAIFRSAVYSYATAEAAPAQMDPALLQSTFRVRLNTR